MTNYQINSPFKEFLFRPFNKRFRVNISELMEWSLFLCRFTRDPVNRLHCMHYLYFINTVLIWEKMRIIVECRDQRFNKIFQVSWQRWWAGPMQWYVADTGLVGGNDHIYRMVKESNSNIWPNQTIVSDQSELTILLCQPMYIYLGY